MAIIRAAATGNYSQGSTWVGGVMPTSGDIAVAGTFRITIDVESVDATLSHCNTDWVNGGGTALATTHTGGFNVPNGASVTIAGLRYGFYQTVAQAAANSLLYVKSGTVTIGTSTYVEGTNITRRCVWVAPTSGTITLTAGTIYLKDGTAVNDAYLFYLVFVANTTWDLTFGDIVPVTGIAPGSSAILSSGTTLTAITATFNGTIYTSIATYFVVNMNTLTATPSGTADMYINAVSQGKGSVGAYALQCSYFRNIYFNNSLSIEPDIATTNVFNLLNVTGSVIVTGDISYPSTAYPSGTITITGNATVTIGGINKPDTTTAVRPSLTLLNLAGHTGVLNITNITVYGATATSVTGNMVVTGTGAVNIGSIFYQGFGCNLVSITSGAGTAPVTINGPISCLGAGMSLSTAGPYNCGLVFSTTTVNRNLTVNGDVSGHSGDGTNVYSTNAGAILDNRIAGTGTITINGTVCGGRWCPGFTQSAIVAYPGNITATTVVGGDHNVAADRTVAGAYLATARMLITNLQCGSSGRFPIDGDFSVLDENTATVQVVNQSWTPITFQKNPISAPSAANVRAGVAFNGTVGTMVVPSASAVLVGTVYDGATVGTLSPVAASGTNMVTSISTAVQDGLWSTASTWMNSAIPDATTFVFTNGKQVEVTGVVSCAGVADNASSGGLILDAGGNTELLLSYGDSGFDDVVVLSRLDSSIANVAISGSTITATGTPTYSSTVKKFSTTDTSMEADPTHPLLVSLPEITATDALTIEFWYYRTSASPHNYMLGVAGQPWTIGGGISSMPTGYFGNDGAYWGACDTTVNAWNHIVITRFGGITRVFYNGVQFAMEYNSVNIPAGNWSFFSAYNISTDSPSNTGDYYSNLRITMGASLRYTAAFTPPITEFPTHSTIPGSTLSGRLLLGANGGVIQSALNPESVQTGILKTLHSIISEQYEYQNTVMALMKAKTDQMTFTVPNSIDATSGATLALGTLPEDIAAIKQVTDKVKFDEIGASAFASDPHHSNVALLSGFNGTNGSTTFSSVVSRVMTPIGDTSISTTKSKFGGSSAKFNSGRLETDVPSLHSDTDFTVEFWAYVDPTQSTLAHLIGSWNGVSTVSWHVCVNGAGQTGFEVSSGGSYEPSNSLIGTFTVTLDAWHHYAFVKNGTTYRLYVDGALNTELVGGPSSMYNAGTGLYIGARSDGTQQFLGYMDSIRVTRGVARYITTFTAPTIDFEGLDTSSIAYYVKSSDPSVSTLSTNISAIKTNTDKLLFTEVPGAEIVGDQYWNNVTLMLHLNGNVTDMKGHTVTNSSGVFTTSQSRTPGGTSIQFNETNYVHTTHADYAFGTGDFTVEFYMYRAELSHVYGGFFSNGFYSTVGGFNIRQCGGGVDVEVVLGPSNTVISPAASATLGAWHHIALSRIEGYTKLFVDGIGSAAVANPNDYTQTSLYLGTDGAYYAGKLFMQDVRVTKGIGRYNANFTPPPIMYDAATTTGPTETHVKASSSGGTVDLTAITTQLTTVLSSLTALETDLSLVEAATSKLSFESVYVNTDPYFNNVSFKAEFNGTHGATAIASDTGLVGTNDYTPSLTTAIKRTGVSSLRLLNSMVYWPDNASQDFGAGDFTIEFSFRADSIPDASTYNGIIGKRYNNSDASYIVYLYNNTLNFLSGDGFALQYSTALSVDTWYDVAISRNGTTIKMYINGVATTGDCTTLNIPVVNAPLMVGALSHSMSGSYMFAGYLDRVRLTKGVGRYGSVAPVSPVTTEYPTSLLGEVGSYKVVANTPDTSALQAALVAKLDDIRNRVNAVHFIVKDE